MVKVNLVLFFMAFIQTNSFKEKQLHYNRVKEAYESKEETVKKYFSQKNISISKSHVFIRAFKKEMKLELWAKEVGKDTYVFIHSYDMCASSGQLGPKRKEGDLQIPEGVYHINHFNPLSNFHLSLGLNYPNASDKILSDKKSPGSAIYIHGNCVTIGCIPITDDKIKELYIIAVEAANNGQSTIPVHIFPCRMDDKSMNILQREHKDFPATIAFWKNLSVVYKSFEETKKNLPVRVNIRGEYYY